MSPLSTQCISRNPVSLKGRIQAVARRFGYDIIRYRKPIHAPFDLLGLLVRDTLPRVSSFTFLQVGAADGISNDPLHASIRAHGLSGVLVEPLPDQCAKLRVAYAGCQGLDVEACAIAATDGTATLYRIRPDAPLPADVQQLASFDRRNLTTAKQGVPGLDAYIEPVQVPTRSIHSLIEQYGLQDLTLLVVDAEGYDAEIVRMALEIVTPAIVLYEHVHLAPAAQEATLRRLRDRGYRFLETQMDTFAVRA